MTRTEIVLSRVRRERERQEDLVRAGKFPWTCADPTAPEGYKWPVLMEEVGEVAEAQLAGDDHLYDELIQVAAVAAAWAESLITWKREAA